MLNRDRQLVRALRCTPEGSGSNCKIGYVYILKSLKNGSYYIGSTVNVEKRLERHNKGRVFATKNLLPLKCTFVQQYNTIRVARMIEYWVKRQKDRKLIERIIAEGFISKKI